LPPYVIFLGQSAPNTAPCFAEEFTSLPWTPSLNLRGFTSKGRERRRRGGKEKEGDGKEKNISPFG